MCADTSVIKIQPSVDRVISINFKTYTGKLSNPQKFSAVSSCGVLYTFLLLRASCLRNINQPSADVDLSNMLDLMNMLPCIPDGVRK